MDFFMEGRRTKEEIDLDRQIYRGRERQRKKLGWTGKR